MGKFRKLIGYGALGVSSAAGLALAERVADPFDRHDVAYALEGPSHHSEVFYMSVNYQSAEGQKQDDRLGDGMIITMIGSLGVAGASAVGRRSESVAAPPNRQVPIV